MVLLGKEVVPEQAPAPKRVLVLQLSLEGGIIKHRVLPEEVLTALVLMVRLDLT